MEAKQSFTQQIADFTSFLAEDYRPTTIKRYSKIVLDFLEWKHADDARLSGPIEISILEHISFINSTSNGKRDIKKVYDLHSICTITT